MQGGLKPSTIIGKGREPETPQREEGSKRQ